MQMQRWHAFGRLALVVVMATVAGCSEGEWDWFGLKKTEPKQKSSQTAKARRPVKKSDAALAESKKKPEAPAGDAKSREVDEKVERYVRAMNAQYDPSYKNDDFTSKIRRQNDPNRPARIKQTVIRSRTEPTLDQAAAQIPERAPGEGSSVQTSTPVKGAEPVDKSLAQKPPEKKQIVPEKPPETKQTVAEKPVEPAKPAPSESAIKPPVLSAVTVSASPTPIDPPPVLEKPKEEKPVEEKPIVSEPVQVAKVDPKPAEPTRSEASPLGHPPSKAKSIDDAPLEKEPVTSPVKKPDHIEPPVKEIPRPVESSPKKESPKIELTSTNERSTEPAPIETARIKEPPLESPPEEPKSAESNAKVSPPAPVVREDRPVKPKRTVANKPPMPPPQPVDTFQRKLMEQEAVVSRSPDNVEEQFKLRMMYLVNGQDDKALAPSSSMNADAQEILLGQIRTMIAARTSDARDPAIWANQQLDALERLRGLLRAKADLRVPNVQLCRSIEGFGRYEPIVPAAFKAGGKNRVLLYIEVDNFHCDQTPSGLYRTLLSVRESLLNKGGEELWSAKDDNIEDLARQKRRDFYLTIGPLAIPKSLGPGEYVFKVEVEDVLGGKMNSNIVRFKMIP